LRISYFATVAGNRSNGRRVSIRQQFAHPIGEFGDETVNKREKYHYH
jgi:hypothetical protein